jgi:hypothetical protein
MVGLIGCCSLPTLAAPLNPADAPARIHVTYDILKGGLKAATITETFTRKQDGYLIESISKAVGLVALIKPETIQVVSQGTLSAKGLRPLTFTNHRTLDSERNSSAEFDWNNGTITLNDRTGKRSLALPESTQDRLSAMYQFMFISLKNVSTLDFYMTNGSKFDIYNYRITQDQTVTIPLGTFKAIYVASQSKPSESRTEIWLATDHFDLPCKMVITDPDGDKISQVLTQIEITP